MSELGIFYPTIPESGGGDFSTATVTFQMQEGALFTVYGALVVEDELDSYTHGSDNITQGQFETVDIILYKNNGELHVDADVTITVVEGNAEIIDGRPLIHGNCTLSVVRN